MVDLQEFASVGENVMIHPTVQVFGAASISIGSHTRIDAFGILSAGTEPVHIGNHVHIAAGVYLFGSSAPVVLENFVGLSAGVRIYTASDDYRDGWLTGPTVPLDLRRLSAGRVRFGKHAIVGAGTVVLPGVDVGFGASVGALSVVRRDVGEGEIVAGNPVQTLGKRNLDRLRELELELARRERLSGPADVR
jgi:galactoside O-acetyltransferase